MTDAYNSAGSGMTPEQEQALARRADTESLQQLATEASVSETGRDAARAELKRRGK